MRGRVGHQAHAVPFSGERYRPAGVAQFAPQSVQRGPHLMCAVRVGPDERSKLPMAQGVGRAMEHAQHLPLSPRKLDLKVGQIAYAVERGGIEDCADCWETDPQPGTAAGALPAGLDRQRLARAETELVPVAVAASPDRLYGRSSKHGRAATEDLSLDCGSVHFRGLLHDVRQACDRLNEPSD
jgi:hypothetical protein